MVPMDRVVEWLNGLQWRTNKDVSARAKALIEEHAERMRTLLQQITAKTGQTPGEAHSDALGAGQDTRQHDRLIDQLFDEGDFSKAGVREPMILIISSCYCWDLDKKLSKFENPWLPLMEVIDMGYPLSFEESVDGMHIELTVGCKNRVDAFKII